MTDFLHHIFLSQLHAKGKLMSRHQQSTSKKKQEQFWSCKISCHAYRLHFFFWVHPTRHTSVRNAGFIFLMYVSHNHNTPDLKHEINKMTTAHLWLRVRLATTTAAPLLTTCSRNWDHDRSPSKLSQPHLRDHQSLASQLKWGLQKKPVRRA